MAIKIWVPLPPSKQKLAEWRANGAVEGDDEEELVVERSRSPSAARSASTRAATRCRTSPRGPRTPSSRRSSAQPASSTGSRSASRTRSTAPRRRRRVERRRGGGEIVLGYLDGTASHVARVRDDELSGYGSTATWAGREETVRCRRPPRRGAPASGRGRSFLVQRGLTSNGECEALVADYVSESLRRNEPAAIVRVGDGLAGPHS